MERFGVLDLFWPGLVWRFVFVKHRMAFVTKGCLPWRSGLPGSPHWMGLKTTTMRLLTQMSSQKDTAREAGKEERSVTDTIRYFWTSVF